MRDNTEKKNEIKTLEEFYSQCVKEFHKETKLMGLIKRGPNEIPELIKYGETLVFIQELS